MVSANDHIDCAPRRIASQSLPCPANDRASSSGGTIGGRRACNTLMKSSHKRSSAFGSSSVDVTRREKMRCTYSSSAKLFAAWHTVGVEHVCGQKVLGHNRASHEPASRQ